MNTSTSTQSQNTDWGFFGSLHRLAESAWPLAMAAIVDATGQDECAVRAFLDGKSGRHFGDDVLNGLHGGLTLDEAIHTTTGRWMAWTIGKLTAKAYGIPRGMPYLSGFVIYEQICAESVEA